ncbi:MAG: DUF5050 domain-containing protein, partial [Clostridia bacterium]|nr:DUF5050 domain-containing protein [Clostridia bacterium]
YTLISLDLVTDKLFTVVPEMVDIQEVLGDEIFFTKVTTDSDGAEKEEFFSYNCKTKRTKAVLSADTEIIDVIDNKIIYFLWTPNDYNKDLHALDLLTGKDIILDHNVFEYYSTIEGMPYYYVGNDNYKTLYRITIDGVNKQEIVNNATFFDKKLCVKNGWIYFAIGFGSNIALAKMSIDGEKQIILCPRFKKLVEIKDGYVYYISKDDALRCVREDGSELTTILEGVGNFIQVTRDAIYLLRKEAVDENNTHVYTNNSLYKVNLEGKGLEKIAFDVNNAITNESDKNEIYLYKTDKITYSIERPISKDQYETTHEIRNINTITVYNIENKSFNDIAVFGKPNVEKFEFKGGCLKKKISKDAIIKEVPNKKTFKRSGKAKAGAIAKEQISSSTAHAPASTNVSKEPSNSKRKFGIVSKSAIIIFVVSFILFIIGLIVNNIGFNIFLVLAFLALIIYTGVMLNKERSRNQEKIDSFRFATILLASIAFIILNIMTLIHSIQ